jgi:hypothetical protein
VEQHASIENAVSLSKLQSKISSDCLKFSINLYHVILILIWKDFYDFDSNLKFLPIISIIYQFIIINISTPHPKIIILGVIDNYGYVTI